MRSAVFSIGITGTVVTASGANTVLNKQSKSLSTCAQNPSSQIDSYLLDAVYRGNVNWEYEGCSSLFETIFGNVMWKSLNVISFQVPVQISYEKVRNVLDFSRMP